MFTKSFEVAHSDLRKLCCTRRVPFQCTSTTEEALTEVLQILLVISCSWKMTTGGPLAKWDADLMSNLTPLGGPAQACAGSIEHFNP